jgi:CcmD family protein
MNSFLTRVRGGGPPGGERYTFSRSFSRMIAPLLAALAISLMPASLAAQDTASPAASPTGAGEPANESVPAATPLEMNDQESRSDDSSVGAAQTGGLPEGSVAPRSQRPYWHVFGAFAAAWVLLFGYAVLLGRRLAAVERELTRAASPRS